MEYEPLRGATLRGAGLRCAFRESGVVESGSEAGGGALGLPSRDRCGRLRREARRRPGRVVGILREHVSLAVNHVSLAADHVFFAEGMCLFRRSHVFFGAEASRFSGGDLVFFGTDRPRRPGSPPVVGLQRIARNGCREPNRMDSLPPGGEAAGTARLPPLPNESPPRPAAPGKPSVVPVLRAPASGAFDPSRCGIGASRRVARRLA